jgi:hypothetical protein
LVAIAIVAVFRPAYRQHVALRQVRALGWGVYVEPRYASRRSSGDGEYLQDKSDSFAFSLRKQVVGVVISINPIPPATGRLPSLESLNALAKFSQLRTLTFYFPTASFSHLQDFAHLADLPQLDALETLYINLGDLQDDDVERIVSRVPNVRHLTMRHSAGLTNRSVRHITRLKQLESLDLTGAAIDDGASADLERLTHLTRIDLSGSKVGDETARALASLPRLTDLSIQRTKMTASGLEAIVRTGKLERLSTDQATLNNDELSMLQRLEPLKRLWLESFDLSIDGACHLAAAPKLEKLILMTMKPPTADPAALAAILNAAGIDFHINLPHGESIDIPAGPARP